MTGNLPKPAIRKRAAFCVSGIGADCVAGAGDTIPALWRRFDMDAMAAANVAPGTAYGVCFGADGQGRFRYLAGVGTRGAVEGRETVEIPAARYAVWTHDGDIADLPRMVGRIWQGGLAAAGLTPAGTPDLELYDDRFDPMTGRGAVEIWIPVV